MNKFLCNLNMLTKSNLLTIIKLAKQRLKEI